MGKTEMTDSPAALGIVLVHYRLPEQRLRDWLSWNTEAMTSVGARAWIVSDVARSELPDWAAVLAYPVALSVFSLARTANFGLRAGIDAGCDVLAKTDADCILSSDLLRAFQALRPGHGFCPRYRMARAADDKSIRMARLHPQLIGTLALRREDWLRIHGYRESLDGYGLDDCDIRDRALQAGVRIPLPLEPKLYHIAHHAGMAQIGPGRRDQWNRATINPKNHDANRARIRSEPWRDENWGRPVDPQGPQR